MKFPIPDFLRKMKKDYLDEFGVVPATADEESGRVSRAELESLPVYRALRDSVKDGMTLDELIDAFAAMVKLPVGASDDLLFETGTYNFTGKKQFYFSLVRQFRYKSADEFVQLHLDVRYTPSPATEQMNLTSFSHSLDPDFIPYVKSTAAYHAVKETPIVQVEVYIEET